ncbi:MAG: PLD nuclease N-terminal domain-containing protein [Gemmatimonadota bacterium]|nr:PLD nuclease N-terminal domain-containing protein [Gemmatimonadota bacterium]
MEGLVALTFSTFFIGLGALSSVFWIWMLIDCAKYEPRKGNDRIVWVLIIALTHLVGALIYYFARRPERIKEHGA